MHIMNTVKAADGRVGPTNGKPYGRCMQAVLLATAVLFALAVSGQVFAAERLYKDELYLKAIIKTIDPKTNLVYADVQSASCPGIRRFHADDLTVLEEYVNQTITFFIDSSTCRDTAIHTIVVSRGVSK